MPKGYVIFTESIRDRAGMDAYGDKAVPSMIQNGGAILVVDEAPDVLEGAWPATRTVVLEFESADAARAWYESADYQAAIPVRKAAADANVVIVSGFEPPAG